MDWNMHFSAVYTELEAIPMDRSLKGKYAKKITPMIATENVPKAFTLLNGREEMDGARGVHAHMVQSVERRPDGTYIIDQYPNQLTQMHNDYENIPELLDENDIRVQYLRHIYGPEVTLMALMRRKNQRIEGVAICSGKIKTSERARSFSPGDVIASDSNNRFWPIEKAIFDVHFRVVEEEINSF